MTTFTSPTYLTPFPSGEGSQRMWRFYDGIPTGYVVMIVGGVATVYPGVASATQDQMAAADAGSGEVGQAVFRGARSYTVTAGETSILQTAGYTVT